jgi:hypothetical protein
VYEEYVELSYGNGQKILRTDLEKIIVTPPISKIIVVGLLTISTLYFYNHRMNLKASWKALTKSS